MSLRFDSSNTLFVQKPFRRSFGPPHQHHSHEPSERWYGKR